MDRIIIEGGVPLKGTIEIGGAKNAALPLMAACLLGQSTLTLSNVPHLLDITTMANLLVHLGVDLSLDGTQAREGAMGRILKLNASNVKNVTAPYEIVRKMRASVVVLGPLLARFGEAKVSLPGGCAIGTRPVNLHLMALEAMQAHIELDDGYIQATAPKGLIGADITFPQVSVGATENVMMAATLAKGTTILRNAAREPEVSDLAHCLNAMGAIITGIDTDTLMIEGVSSLGKAAHRVVSDRIEAGTYACAAAITGGEILLKNIPALLLTSTNEALKKAGVAIKETSEGLLFSSTGALKALNLETAPYPAFATDMQAQMMALLCLAKGDSQIQENIFENRFMHVPELNRMGANIEAHGNTAIIHGIDHFKGAEVMATDLRASVSLVLAALAARGETVIHRVYHIDRGYEYLEEKLSACGAKITRSRQT